ncbi:4506_t:CDS:1, partial [Dentiscutata heterogama]
MQTQRYESKDLSEVDSLKQRIIDLKTENASLRDKLNQTVKENK